MLDSRSISLYVHIPFCETKCPYCDFNTYAGIESLIPDYVAALRTEIRRWGGLLGRPALGTVFFGGGTPSYLPPDDIGSLMKAVFEAFEVYTAAEVTLEANPDDVTGARLASYLESGINRLSIGVQSLDDRLLELLGRRHSASQAMRAYLAAVDAGYDSVSIDLMYGLPHQGLDSWEQTLSAAADLGPEHISMYCLTLEAGTPMSQWVESGRLPAADPDLAADMYLAAEEAMEGRGYRHYEISNWALPGKESRHNLTYWRNQPYLGVGPGAHSYLAGSRFHNVKSPRVYTQRLEGWGNGTAPKGSLSDERIRSVPVVETVEPIDRRLEMAETMMLGLRLDTGVESATFEERFGTTLQHAYSDILHELESAGLLVTSESGVRLTGRGRLLGNEVFSSFFGAAEPPQA